LSEKEIQIQTDFNGKEIIIFGILQKNQDTIISIKGPNKDTSVLKKERILGFWFNTKRVIYKNLPSLFFISSSKPVEDILSKESIIKEKLYFNELLVNAITQRDFIDQKKLEKWNKNLVDLKFSENLFKEYEFQNVDNKLFQTRIFFPSNSVPGKYKVTIYQVKNQKIQNKQNRVINIKKSGIGPHSNLCHENKKRNNMHTIERQKEQLEISGIKSFPNPNLNWLFSSSKKNIQKKPFALIVPGGSKKRLYKRIPNEIFLKIINFLKKKNVLPILIGAKDDEEICKNIKYSEPFVKNFCSKLDIFGVGKLAKDASVSFGNDTGPMHLIAKANKPSFVFFTKHSKPELCAPRGKKVKIMTFKNDNKKFLNQLIKYTEKII